LSDKTAVQHASFNTMPVEALNPLIDRQMVYGEQSMLARIILRKGAVVPRHSHVNEQITYILEGALRFTLDDSQVLTVRAGETLVIPSNVPHQPRPSKIPSISMSFVPRAPTGSPKPTPICAGRSYASGVITGGAASLQRLRPPAFAPYSAMSTSRSTSFAAG